MLSVEEDFLKPFIYLKGRVTERACKRDGQRNPLSTGSLQMLKTTGARPGQPRSQELHSGLSWWVMETQVFWPPAASPGTLARRKLAKIPGTPIQEVGDLDNGLTC